MGGGGRVLKKIKRVKEVLGFKRVPSKTDKEESCSPMKKDTRGWLWKSTTKTAVGPGNVPHIGLQSTASFSTFVDTIAPGNSLPTAHPTAPTPVSHTAVPLSHAHFLASSGFPTDPPHPTQLPQDLSPAEYDAESDVSESDDEAAEPDDQDGVAGNYHHVSLLRDLYHPPTLTVCSHQPVHTNS